MISTSLATREETEFQCLQMSNMSQAKKYLTHIVLHGWTTMNYGLFMKIHQGSDQGTTMQHGRHLLESIEAPWQCAAYS